MKITKANFTQRRTYIRNNDLYGFINVDNHDCQVEFNGKLHAGATAFVAIAPAGMQFCPGNVPFLRFNSLPALRGLLNQFTLQSEETAAK